MKLRLSRNLHDCLCRARDTYDVAVAEICRRAWRRAMRLEREGAGVVVVALRDFRDTATRPESTVIEIVFPGEPHLADWADCHTGLELASLVAWYLATEPATPSRPPFVPDLVEGRDYLVEA